MAIVQLLKLMEDVERLTEEVEGEDWLLNREEMDVSQASGELFDVLPEVQRFDGGT